MTLSWCCAWCSHVVPGNCTWVPLQLCQVSCLLNSFSSFLFGVSAIVRLHCSGQTRYNIQMSFCLSRVPLNFFWLVFVVVLDPDTYVILPLPGYFFIVFTSGWERHTDRERHYCTRISASVVTLPGIQTWALSSSTNPVG